MPPSLPGSQWSLHLPAAGFDAGGTDQYADSPFVGDISLVFDAVL